MELLHELSPGCVVNIPANLVQTLNQHGEIFTIFDKQDSGNVAYGWAVPGRKIWVKQAAPQVADILKEASDFYATFRHPLIPRYIGAGRFADGYAVFFEWVPGRVLRAADEDRTRPGSTYQRFQSLPISPRIAVLERIVDLFVRLERSGYIIEDFYDGCIIYDFVSGGVSICDLDHVHHGVFVMERERLYGSSRFMAPEEFIRGSRIDFRTNVYTLGASAFVLLADNRRTRDGWPASDALFDVAEKATAVQPSRRFQSVCEYAGAFLEAL